MQAPSVAALVSACPPELGRLILKAPVLSTGPIPNGLERKGVSRGGGTSLPHGTLGRPPMGHTGLRDSQVNELERGAVLPDPWPCPGLQAAAARGSGAPHPHPPPPTWAPHLSQETDNGGVVGGLGG